MKKSILFFILAFSATALPAAEITVSSETALKSAIAAANPGDIIRVSGGVYSFSTNPGINITRSGTENSMIKLYAAAGAKPVFNFSGQTRNSSSARGLELKASYWHIKGIAFQAAGDNGMIISNGHHNIIEQCEFFECNDSGLQIDNGSSENLVLNCDSYANADITNENADGFAPKLGVGNNNRFKGCRAWRNLDDGFDGYLRGSDNVTTYYENCWTIQNGYNKDGQPGTGDGNGFKTGGSDDKLLKHNASLVRCIAIGNRVKGFDHNSNRGDVTLYHCAATANGTNMGFGNTNPVNKLTIKNTVVVGPTGNLNATVKDISHNSWDSGITADATDYEDFTDFYEQMIAPRKSDGSLPDVAFWRLSTTSDLVDAGIDVGLPFNDSAPDIGPFEFGNAPPPVAIPSDEPGNHGKVVSEKYFTITGQTVDQNHKGLIVIYRIYENGKTEVKKVFRAH